MEPPVTILATDISGDALARARAGQYRSRSVRELSPVVRRRYFHERGENLVVGERLRALVRFGLHNLVRDTAPPPGEAPFHLILCRNVLIYFDGETVEQVIASLENALEASGMLLLGAADALCGSAGRLRLLADAKPVAEPHARRPQRPLRRPQRLLPSERPSDPLTALAQAFGAGHPDEVISQASTLLAKDPLNGAAYFLRGLAHLEAGDAAAAVASLRRALYVEPRLGLAAFHLGRAHEALGDLPAARRAYEQALRTLDLDSDAHDPMLEQVDLVDVAAAARTRLEGLAAVGIAGKRAVS
jgi:chemotaxis protein methyltransferase CheR